MFYYMHNNTNYHGWNKALTFGVDLIQLSFRTIVFTQYMQRCFQSKCYCISVKLSRGFHFSAFHYTCRASPLSAFGELTLQPTHIQPRHKRVREHVISTCTKVGLGQNSLERLRADKWSVYTSPTTHPL